MDETDFVVVGSGVGGLTAAVTAATESDCSAVVLEKASVLGGSSGLSGGQLWIPDNHYASADGIEDDPDAGAAYMAALAGDHYAAEDAIRRYVEAAPEAIRYLTDATPLSLHYIRDMPDYHLDYPGAKAEGRYLEPEPHAGDLVPDWATLPQSPHLPGGATNDEILDWGGTMTPGDWDWDVISERREEGVLTMGTALVAALLAATADLSVDVRADAGVTDLIEEDGRVTGVIYEGAEGSQKLAASEGVLLATGAYDWNDEFVASFEGTPADYVLSSAVPTATGDGLRLAALQGAKLGTYPPIGSAKSFFIEVPDREFLDAPLHRYCYNVGLPHALAVNAHGERFCDESFYPRQAESFYDPTGEYPDFPPYMIFDETYRQTYPLANYQPGTEYPEEFLAATGDSLAELAGELGIDPETLEATVERFNEHARRGEDPDFHRGDNAWANKWCGDPHHKPNPNLGPVAEPPFYAVRLYVGLSSAGNVGLVTDRVGGVLDWNDEQVPGLYATGSVCAPVEWGVGYQSGLQNGRSLTYGHLVGREVAAAVDSA